MRPFAGTAAILALALTTPAMARTQATERDGSETVNSTVIVDGKVQQSGPVPRNRSGLSIQPPVENEAERARRDAVDGLAVGDATGSNLRPAGDTSTTVVVDGVVSESNSGQKTSCVQIGVIGRQPQCRPDR